MNRNSESISPIITPLISSSRGSGCPDNRAPHEILYLDSDFSYTPTLQHPKSFQCVWWWSITALWPAHSELIPFPRHIYDRSYLSPPQTKIWGRILYMLPLSVSNYIKKRIHQNLHLDHYFPNLTDFERNLNSIHLGMNLTIFVSVTLILRHHCADMKLLWFTRTLFWHASTRYHVPCWYSSLDIQVASRCPLSSSGQVIPARMC